MVLLKIELASAPGGLRVSFGVALNGIDVKIPSQELANNNPTIKPYEMDVGSGLQINLHPFISLEMFDGVKKVNAVNFAGINKKYLEEDMSYVLYKIKTEKDLFYRVGGKLVVDNEKAKQFTRISSGSKGLQMMFRPIVLDDRKDNKQYEAVMIAISNVSNHLEITFSEFEYILNIIKRTDMQLLALQLVNTYYNYSNDKRNFSFQNDLGMTVTKMVKKDSEFKKGLAYRLDNLESNLK